MNDQYTSMLMRKIDLTNIQSNLKIINKQNFSYKDALEVDYQSFCVRWSNTSKIYGEINKRCKDIKIRIQNFGVGDPLILAI